ncbi:MAG: hypothetical protein RL687_240 [Candidatus Parcubacteria bacterium]|jgi:uncharacterized membrane protein YuzA (DUF378 family)
MNSKTGCAMYMVAKILVIVGALNWGLYGVGMFMGSNLNLVNIIFGGMPTIESIVYVLVGISGVVMIFGCPCGTCKAGCTDCKVEEVPAAPVTPAQ